MIRYDHVSKTYRRSRRPALSDIDLEVQRGDFAFIVGQSGSGKSTLLRMALREEIPSEGTVMVAGHDVGRMPHRRVPRLRREMGTVFQDFRLLPNKTVYQNVAFALQVLGRSSSNIRQVVPETLEMVGLAGKGRRLPHELSGGEQQRVAIARAFVNKPAILLADEPTGNLDPATSMEIVRLLDRINRTGTTIVMATHDHEIVNQMAKRVIELEDGRVIRDAVGGYGEGLMHHRDTITVLNAQGLSTGATAATLVEERELAEAAATAAESPAGHLGTDLGDQERLGQERLEQERIEQERIEQERLEQERLEQERIEQERARHLGVDIDPESPDAAADWEPVPDDPQAREEALAGEPEQPGEDRPQSFIDQAFTTEHDYPQPPEPEPAPEPARQRRRGWLRRG